MTQVKIIVFSDSHGDRESMVLAAGAERPDVIFHLGDCWRDAEELEYAFPGIPLYQVPGNCDWSMAGEPTEQKVTLDGVCFLLCHGHTYCVKSGYYSAVSHAEQAGADVLLCGHTHVPCCEDYGGIQLLNPGSVGQGCGRTYAVITTQQGVAHCSIHPAP